MTSKNANEEHLQKALVWYWLKGNPDKHGVPRSMVHLAPGVVFWHTPNGGHRSAKEGKDLKEMGVAAGIHDLLFLKPTYQQMDGRVIGTLFGLELKEPNGKGRISTAQRVMHERLRLAGLADSVVLDNLAECKEWLIARGLAIA